MKKILLTMWLGLAASLVFAQQGGFTDPSVSDSNQTVAVTDANEILTSVSMVEDLDNDSNVRIRGYILQYLGKDKYLFREPAGIRTVIIKIDNNNWHGIIGVNDLVDIKGKINKDENSFKIDVYSVQKVTIE